MSNGRSLKDFVDELQKCSKCGSCRSVCPIFAVTGREKHVARGKLALAEAVLEGQLDLTNEFSNILNNCLLCLSCVEICNSGVAVDKVIKAARIQLVDHKGLSPFKKFIFRVMITGKGLQFFSKRGALLKYSLFKKIPKTSGLTRRFPLPFIEKKRYLPDFVKEPFREKISIIKDISNPLETVIFFTGCATNYIYTDIAWAIVKVLNHIRINVIVPKAQSCCGAPVEAGGDYQTALDLAKNNLRELIHDNRDFRIIVPCSSGGFMFKYTYPEFFKNSSKWKKKADTLAARTYDISEYLVNEIGLDKIRPMIKKNYKRKITYHDPCHLNRGQGITNEPRALLKLACGTNFVEMDSADKCCGAGGLYGISHSVISDEILDEKITKFERSGAREIATGCPGCMIQLKGGTLNRGINAKVSHTIEILAQCMDLI